MQVHQVLNAKHMPGIDNPHLGKRQLKLIYGYFLYEAIHRGDFCPGTSRRLKYPGQSRSYLQCMTGFSPKCVLTTYIPVTWDGYAFLFTMFGTFIFNNV